MANVVCPVCGLEFIGARNQQYCSPKCRKRATMDTYKKNKAEQEHKCAWCGKTFKGDKRKYCGKACRHLANGHMAINSPLNPNATKVSKSIDEVDRYCKEHNITYGEYSCREQIAKMKGETL